MEKRIAKYFFRIEFVFVFVLIFSACHRNQKPEIKNPPAAKPAVSVKEFGVLMNALLREKNINSGGTQQLVQNFFAKYPNAYFTGENYEFFSESEIHNGSLYPEAWYSYNNTDSAYSDFHLTLDSLETATGIKYVFSIAYCYSFDNRISVSSPWTHEKELNLSVFIISKNKNEFKVIWQDNVEENFSSRNILPFKIISEKGQNAVYYEWNKREGNPLYGVYGFTLATIVDDEVIPIIDLKSCSVKQDSAGYNFWEDFSFQNNFSKFYANGDIEFDVDYSISSTQQMINNFRGLLPDKPVQLIRKKGKVIYSLVKSQQKNCYEIKDERIYSGRKSAFFIGESLMIYDPDDPGSFNSDFRIAFEDDLKELMNSGTKDQTCVASYFLSN